MSKENDTREQLKSLLAQVRDNLKAELAKKEEYDLCGFDFTVRKSEFALLFGTPIGAH